MVIRPYILSQLSMGDFTLAGYSVAGEESVVIAPELNCCFDIGKCPREALTVDGALGRNEQFLVEPFSVRFSTGTDLEAFGGIEGTVLLVDPAAKQAVGDEPVEILFGEVFAVTGDRRVGRGER